MYLTTHALRQAVLVTKMLIIRAEQMATFGDAHGRAFEERALAYLRQTRKKDYARLGEQGSRALISDVSERAGAYGIEAEEGVIVWLDLTLDYGADFDAQEEWAAYILQYDELAADDKVARLKNYVLREVESSGANAALDERK